MDQVIDTLYVHPVKTKCNAKCSFCITKKQILDLDQYPQFLQRQCINFDEIQVYLKKHPEIKRIEITGGGEPSLHPRLNDIIGSFSMMPEIQTYIYTNGIQQFDIFTTVECITVSSKIDFLDIVHKEAVLKHYRNFCKKLRLRTVICDNEYDVIGKHSDETLRVLDFVEKIPIDELVIAKDFTSLANISMADIHPIFKNRNFNIKIDNGEKKCTEYPILYTDGKIHENWNFILRKSLDELKTGYHLKNIQKYPYGTPKKVLEEVMEFLDAVDQKNKIMILTELSDIIGSITGYLEKNFSDFTIDDLLQMSQATQRAFKNGHRS